MIGGRSQRLSSGFAWLLSFIVAENVLRTPALVPQTLDSLRFPSRNDLPACFLPSNKPPTDVTAV